MAPVLSAPLANANFFNDLWNDFISPFTGKSATSSQEAQSQSNAQPYNPLGSAISDLRVGETITIKILRDENEMTVNATLEKRPNS